jgi:hypothetical protein
MDRNCECIEQAVADGRQDVVHQLGSLEAKNLKERY